MHRWIAWVVGGVGVLIGVVVIGVLLFGQSLQDRAWEYLHYGYILPENIERRLATIDGEEVSFLIVRGIDAMQWDFANNPSEPQSVHAWREALNAKTVVNGSYFTEGYMPAGYYSLLGNANTVCPPLSSSSDAFGYTFGVWIVNDQLGFGSVMDNPWICGGPNAEPVTAFASFPTLVKDNQVMIEEDSGLLAHRTMLAQTVSGEKWIVVTESGELSLYRAAQWFVAQNEDFRIVGNLDGGPSTGLSIAQEPWDIEVPSAVVPNVIFAR